jgi:hypothetical protein
MRALRIFYTSTQLSVDDDDDAPPSSADKTPALDFGKLSDVLTSSNARPPIPDESNLPWAAIALLACGALTLGAGAFSRS